METLRINDDSDLHQIGQVINNTIEKYIKDSECFVITNMHAGILINDLECFTTKLFSESIVAKPNTIFELGSFDDNGTKVYIDATMCWEDTRVLFFTKKECESISESYRILPYIAAVKIELQHN